MPDDETVYTFFHENGPIRWTETELANDYMRLRDENESQAAFIGSKGLGDEYTAFVLARRAEADALLAEEPTS